MKDPLILKILDLFSFLFTHQNVNYEQVRLLLKIKLLQDYRKPSVMFRNIRQGKNKNTNMLFISLIYFLFMGIIIIPFIILMSIKSMLIGSIGFYTILMSFISYAIILEFSLDFFDTSDHTILLSKPFGLREMNIAKSIHIFLYMSIVATVFALPSLVFWGLHYNIAVSLTAFIFVILSIFFLLFCSSWLYSIILCKYSGEKLKDTLSILQIGFIIIIYTGSQVFSQTSHDWFSKIDITEIPFLLYFFPPTWFALPAFMVGTGFFSIIASIVVLAGIIITFTGYSYYLKHQAYVFEKNLYKMDLVDNDKIKKTKLIPLKFAQLFSNNLNRAFYKFSVIILSRERRLKQVIFPIMAMSFIYPVFALYRTVKDPETVLIGSSFFLYLYFVVAFLLPISIYTNFSEDHKASWLYYYLPLKTPGNIILGAKMAALASYQSIVLIILSFIFLVFWKFTIIPDIIIILLNALIIQFIFENLAKRKLPFSEEIKTGRNSAFQHFSYYLSVFVFVPLAAMIHYLVHNMVPVLTIPLIIIQAVAIYLFMKNHYDITWEEIQ